MPQLWDTQAPAAADPSSAANVAAKPPVPQFSEFATLEDIINMWNKDLACYTQRFKDTAREVSKWDVAIGKVSHQVVTLYEYTKELKSSQCTIDHRIKEVELQQQEMVSELERYETELRALLSQTTRAPVSVADRNREQALQQSANVSNELDIIEDSLEKLVKEINDKSGLIAATVDPCLSGQKAVGQERDGDPPQNNITNIVQVMNAHLRSLEWIDESARDLHRNLELAAHYQQDANREQERLHRERTGL